MQAGRDAKRARSGEGSGAPGAPPPMYGSSRFDVRPSSGLSFSASSGSAARCGAALDDHSDGVVMSREGSRSGARRPSFDLVTASELGRWRRPSCSPDDAQRSRGAGSLVASDASAHRRQSLRDGVSGLSAWRGKRAALSCSGSSCDLTSLPTTAYVPHRERRHTEVALGSALDGMREYNGCGTSARGSDDRACSLSGARDCGERGGARGATPREALWELESRCGPGPRIGVLGPTRLSCPESEPLLRGVAEALSGRLGAAVLTSGLPAQRAFAQACGGSLRLLNVAPPGRAPGEAEACRERYGRLGDVYLLVEGGASLAAEARAIVERGAAIVPLGRTGGASAGLYCEEPWPRPQQAAVEQWEMLSRRDLPVWRTAGVAAELVAALCDGPRLGARALGASERDLAAADTEVSGQSSASQSSAARVGRHASDDVGLVGGSSLGWTGYAGEDEDLRMRLQRAIFDNCRLKAAQDSLERTAEEERRRWENSVNALIDSEQSVAALQADSIGLRECCAELRSQMRQAQEFSDMASAASRSNVEREMLCEEQLRATRTRLDEIAQREQLHRRAHHEYRERAAYLEERSEQLREGSDKLELEVGTLRAALSAESESRWQDRHAHEKRAQLYENQLAECQSRIVQLGEAESHQRRQLAEELSEHRSRLAQEAERKRDSDEAWRRERDEADALRLELRHKEKVINELAGSQERMQGDRERLLDEIAALQTDHRTRLKQEERLRAEIGEAKAAYEHQGKAMQCVSERYQAELAAVVAWRASEEQCSSRVLELERLLRERDARVDDALAQAEDGGRASERVGREMESLQHELLVFRRDKGHLESAVEELERSKDVQAQSADGMKRVLHSKAQALEAARIDLGRLQHALEDAEDRGRRSEQELRAALHSRTEQLEQARCEMRQLRAAPPRAGVPTFGTAELGPCLLQPRAEAMQRDELWRAQVADAPPLVARASEPVQASEFAMGGHGLGGSPADGVAAGGRASGAAAATGAAPLVDISLPRAERGFAVASSPASARWRLSGKKVSVNLLDEM